MGHQTDDTIQPPAQDLLVNQTNAVPALKEQVLVGELLPPEQDPIYAVNLCPEIPAQPMVDAHGNPVRTDIKLIWNPPFGPGVSRGICADYDGDTPSCMGMGRYYSESIDDRPLVDGLGRLKEFQYRQHVSTARYYEAIKHNDRAVYGESSTRMRPSRRKLLVKLARYKQRAK